jgi:hypothetical protein
MVSMLLQACSAQSLASPQSFKSHLFPHAITVKNIKLGTKLRIQNPAKDCKKTERKIKNYVSIISISLELQLCRPGAGPGHGVPARRRSETVPGLVRARSYFDCGNLTE